jgi:hypothetical protein
MNRKQASDFDQRVLDLYDDYAHGRISRRDLVRRAAAYVTAGMTVEALLASLSPNYAWAQQVAADDARIHAESFTYDSPQGGGKIRGLLARPAKDGEKFPAVLVLAVGSASKQSLLQLGAVKAAGGATSDVRLHRCEMRSGVGVRSGWRRCE